MVVVVDLVTEVAPSGVSANVTEVVWPPGVVENPTPALMAPRSVPAGIGVVAVDVQVSTVSATERAHDQPAGVGAVGKVAPLGAVRVTTGSVSAGPPEADTEGVTTTVPVEPVMAVAGPETVRARVGGALVVVVVDLVTEVAPSGVSANVTEVVWAPGVVENPTPALMAPRSVPAGIGVVAVDVQVSTVSATERAHDQPAGVGAVGKVAPLGAVRVTTGSVSAGPPLADTEGVTTTVPVEPVMAVAGPETVRARVGGSARGRGGGRLGHRGGPVGGVGQRDRGGLGPRGGREPDAGADGAEGGAGRDRGWWPSTCR